MRVPEDTHFCDVCGTGIDAMSAIDGGKCSTCSHIDETDLKLIRRIHCTSCRTTSIIMSNNEIKGCPHCLLEDHIVFLNLQNEVIE